MKEFQALLELEGVYDAMMPAQVRTKECFAWFTGILHPLFNAVMHLSETNKIDTLISQAPANTPISFWMHSQNGSKELVEVIKEKGFQLIVTCPLMTWQVKGIDAPKSEIKAANLEIFHNILAAVFHFDEGVKDGFARLLGNSDAENYLIFSEGNPIGSGTLFSNGKTGGIFNIATLPDHQKRGFGTSMMKFLMNRAYILGLENLVLLSSPTAEKFYSELGFSKSLDIEIYAR